MNCAELRDRSIVLLGLGREGLATFAFLRARFPEKLIAIADRSSLETLGADTRRVIEQDRHLRLHLGADHQKALVGYDVIVKSPGVPSDSADLRRALAQGSRLTSHAAIFFSHWPGTVVSVTGTKGKSTTTTLIYRMLRAAGRGAHLVGNIGQPPLEIIGQAKADDVFVYELSSQQLEHLAVRSRIAVLLGIAPEHLDYHPSMDAYVEAKSNVTRYQTTDDLLVYFAESESAAEIAAESRARKVPFRITEAPDTSCFVRNGVVTWVGASGTEPIIATVDVPLLGEFNLQNVLAATAAARLLDVPSDAIAEAIRQFQSLEHRFECVGTYRGVTFYNASIATVPEATIAHLRALDRVDTLIAGGHDRGLDLDALGRQIVLSGVRTLILFPATGVRIAEAVRSHVGNGAAPAVHFVRDMGEALRQAYAGTPAGGVCLHSPAAASYGLFRDYRERGEAFKRWVVELSVADR